MNESGSGSMLRWSTYTKAAANVGNRGDEPNKEFGPPPDGNINFDKYTPQTMEEESKDLDSELMTMLAGRWKVGGGDEGKEQRLIESCISSKCE